ncbi:MAG: (Fe-S)-binding protein [Bacteroidia bacterium]|nr:(Fe-S)-binding protein [Bacteroidia bacterium]
MIVDLFIPCYIDQFQPETARNTLKVLQRMGCGVNYNIEQTCCGQPAYEDGYRDYCKEVGEKLIHEFQDDRYIVCPGPGCVNTVRHYYPALFHNSALHNEYKMVQKHFIELGDFLVNVMHATDIGASFTARALVLDGCVCKSDSPAANPQLALLKKVRNLVIAEPSDILPCCGIGGGLDRKNEALTVKMANDLLKVAGEVGADTLISNDPLCLMHLQGVISKQHAPFKTIHLADVLASGWE